MKNNSIKWFANSFLMRFDLYKPRLSEYIGMTHCEGFSINFISWSQLDEVIMPSRTNLDILLSGAIPHNSAELID